MTQPFCLIPRFGNQSGNRLQRGIGSKGDATAQGRSPATPLLVCFWQYVTTGSLIPNPFRGEPGTGNQFNLNDSALTSSRTNPEPRVSRSIPPDEARSTGRIAPMGGSPDRAPRTPSGLGARWFGVISSTNLATSAPKRSLRHSITRQIAASTPRKCSGANPPPRAPEART